MVIETRYDYIYYTVLDQDWMNSITRTLESDWTAEILCNVINKKLKESKDWTLNNLKVDYVQHCDDIDDWIRMHNRHKDRPVFVQMGDTQPIITTGQGSLFVLYEEEDDEVIMEQVINNRSYYNGPDCIDGLAGAGGRL
jgi:hypothetical protein